MNGEQNNEKKKTMRATRLSEQEKEMTNETPNFLKLTYSVSYTFISYLCT